MDDRYFSNKEQEDIAEVAEHGSESPPSTMFNDMKMASTSSPKRSKRAMQKRVVSIPIKDAEGSRLKGESAPPSDSWAWRKYGQKPIKGSPYPRGYYRCSSSKGCPARKQVERSRLDPTMLVVTYSSEHNHPWPTSRTHRHHHSTSAPGAAKTITDKPEIFAAQPDPDDKFSDLNDDSLIASTAGDEFSWFGDMETTSSTVLEIPIFAEISVREADVAMIFPMREEDESLFADLGELPECTVVFGGGGVLRGGVGPRAEIC